MVSVVCKHGFIIGNPVRDCKFEFGLIVYTVVEESRCNALFESGTAFPLRNRFRYNMSARSADFVFTLYMESRPEYMPSCWITPSHIDLIVNGVG